MSQKLKLNCIFLLWMLSCLFLPHYLLAQEPSYGTATIDGNAGEWDLTKDFFANMYRAGKSDKPIETKLYVRYDCANKKLYVLVLSDKQNIITSLLDDHFVKLGNSTKLVDGNNQPANFRFIGLTQDGKYAKGWEACASLVPGDYTNLNVHTQVFSDNEAQTSAVSERAIPIKIVCKETPPPVLKLNLTSECTYDNNERRWRVTNPNSFNVEVKWEVYPNKQTGTLTATPGLSYFFTKNFGDANTTIIYWKDENGKEQSVTKASNNQVCDICAKEGINKEQRYQLYNAVGQNANHSFWIQDLFCAGQNAIFTFDNTDKGYIYIVDQDGNSKDGWLHVVGTARVTGGDCGYLNTRWDVDVWFKPADGIQPKLEGPCQNTTGWQYWTLDAGKLTRKDKSDYVQILPMQMPYGFQLGKGANGKNCNLGASTWFNYAAKLGDKYFTGKKHGDINVDLKKICENKPTAKCGDVVGGSGNAFDWNKVVLYGKQIGGASFSTSNIEFASDGTYRPNSGGIGVVGPEKQEGDPTRNLEINYIAEKGQSEILKIDFGDGGDFTGADVLLSRFYGKEGNKGETGCWRAFDKDYKLVGQGNFEATENIYDNGPGHFLLQIKTAKVFRYLEFTAGPYINTKLAYKTYADNSDYLIRKITLTCFDIVDCGDLVGGDGFGSWNPVGITVKKSNNALFQFIGDAVFNGELNGLGVPEGEDENEINGTEAMRIDIGNPKKYIQLSIALLSEGEKGFFKAYKKDNCGLKLVSSGEFTGTDDTDLAARGTVLAGKGGNSSVVVQSQDDFDVVEIGSGPIQNKGEEDEYIVNSFIIRDLLICEPVCELECKDIIGGNGKQASPGNPASWNQVSVSVRKIDEIGFSPAQAENFNNDITSDPTIYGLGSGGIGIPGPESEGNGVFDRFLQINYLKEYKKSEAVRIEFCRPIHSAKAVISRLYAYENGQQAERGYWIAYKKTNNGLVAVGNGEFVGEQICCTTGNVGRVDVFINGEEAFQVIEFFAGPYKPLAAKDALPDDNSDYYIYQIIPCAEKPASCTITTQVIEFKQGKTKDNKNVPANRSDANKALGAPQRNDGNGQMNFVSLGFGGSITLKFDHPVYDKPGFDIELFETSWGNPNFNNYPEQAEVFASADGTTWKSLGKTQLNKPRPKNANNNKDNLGAKFDLNGKLNWAQYIKIVDCTDKSSKRFPGSADGYDVDGVVCLNNVAYKQAYNDEDFAQNDEQIELLMGENSIYPNPVQEKIAIDFNNEPEFVSPEDGRIKVEIYSGMGTKVLSQEMSLEEGEFKFDVNASQLRKGVYIIKVTTGNVTRTQRIVKE